MRALTARRFVHKVIESEYTTHYGPIYYIWMGGQTVNVYRHIGMATSKITHAFEILDTFTIPGEPTKAEIVEANKDDAFSEYAMTDPNA